MAKKKVEENLVPKVRLKVCRADLFAYCDDPTFEGETCPKDARACKFHVGANQAYSEMLGRDVSQDATHHVRAPAKPKPGETASC